MKKNRFGSLAVLLCCATLVSAATTNTPWSAEIWQLKRDTLNVGHPYTGATAKASCQAAALAAAEARTTSGNYFCHGITGTRVTYSAAPAACTTQPSSTPATIACAAGFAPPWTQTTTVTVGPAPACVVTTTLSPTTAPATACQAIPPATTWTRLGNEGATFTVPANSTIRYGAGATFIQRTFSGTFQCTNEAFGNTDPVPNTPKVCEILGAYIPPAATPTVLYFSDCATGAAAGCVPGSNSNPGTQASPKQTLSGIDVNALAAGSQLLFKRDGSWNWGSTMRLDNRNVSAAAPLTFGAWGTGAAPLLRVAALYTWEFGVFDNLNPDGGYVFRGLKLDGLNHPTNASFGIWLRGTVSDVLMEDMEITGFYIGINGQGHNDIQRVTVRNSNIHHNRGMGVLGTFNNSLFEGNLVEANNFSGSAFEHGMYVSNHTNLTLRNNILRRNSVTGGQCTGGNLTMHGQNEGLVVEGNTIEQDASAPGCWGISLTQAYSTAEWFLSTVVRNNKLVNVGNSAILAQSAPGVLIEGNVVINTTPTYQAAISVGSNEYQGGDIADGNAIVRNNTACQSGGASGPVVNLTAAPGSTLTNNVVVTGAAATTGICAR